jgi:hypothetical protein
MTDPWRLGAYGEYPIINESLSRDFSNVNDFGVYQVHMSVALSQGDFQRLADYLETNRDMAWEVLQQSMAQKSGPGTKPYDWIRMLFT